MLLVFERITERLETVVGDEPIVTRLVAHPVNITSKINYPCLATPQ